MRREGGARRKEGDQGCTASKALRQPCRKPYSHCLNPPNPTPKKGARGGTLTWWCPCQTAAGPRPSRWGVKGLWLRGRSGALRGGVGGLRRWGKVFGRGSRGPAPARGCGGVGVLGGEAPFQPIPPPTSPTGNPPPPHQQDGKPPHSLPPLPLPPPPKVCAELGLPYREGLVKNRYVGRTFIMPDQVGGGVWVGGVWTGGVGVVRRGVVLRGVVSEGCCSEGCCLEGCCSEGCCSGGVLFGGVLFGGVLFGGGGRERGSTSL